MENKIIIGIDLGGTKIMTGAINFDGKVLGTPIKVLTIGDDKPEAIVKRITDSVEKTLKGLNASINDVAGIGLGSTGPLDLDTGQILECPQLPRMHFFPVRKTISDHFGTSVFLNNDANCLIYGETIFGAAAGMKNVVGFTLGTGLGCAIIIDRKLVNGSTGTAGEVWISPYRDGNIEDYVCGGGVSNIYKSLTGIYKSSYDVFNLAAEGNEQALKTWDEFGYLLSVPLAWSINILDPEAIILGGSITAAYRFFRSSLETNLKKHICPVPAVKTKIVLAELGDNAGFIGACCLVLDNLKNKTS